jgi:hypothetical protein
MMDLDAARMEYHRVRIARATESFSRNLFATHHFETQSDAVDFFFSEVSPGESIGYGGSDTARQLGIMGRLRSEGYNFLDRSKFGHSYDEQLDIRRRTLSADVFISSSNAVSIGGALVNIDGTGNRVAGLSFGPRRVFLFIQLGKETPCVKTGRCHDCASPDRICSTLSIIERCEPAGRISLLFINEDLGL